MAKENRVSKMSIGKIVGLVLFLAGGSASAAPSDSMNLPTSKDLKSEAQNQVSMTGSGFSAHVKIHPEKSEYLFSFDVEKAKTGTRYEIELVDSCALRRSTASEANLYRIGDFKGVRGGLLTEFFVRKDKISGSEGGLKFGFLAISEKSNKGSHQVSCQSIVQ